MIGNPIGEHRQADGRDVEGAGAMHRAPVRHRGHLCADEDPGGAVAQGMQAPADPLEGLPRAGQQHPHLWVRKQHFVLGQPEERPIEEPLPILADQPFPGAREAARARESTDRPVAPSVALGDRLLDDLPFAEQAPEVLVAANSARHAVAVSRDGDRNRGIRRVHVPSILQVTPPTRWLRPLAGLPRLPGEPAPRERGGPAWRGPSHPAFAGGTLWRHTYIARTPMVPIPYCYRRHEEF